jgi:uncharacterized protein (TIGR00304 family)
MIGRMLNRYFAFAGALFTGGILLLLLSVIRGEGTAGIALFIPFFYGTGPFSSLGVLLIFLGIAALFYAFVRGAMSAALEDERNAPGGMEERPQEARAPARRSETPAPQTLPGSNIRGGAVIMVGPVPIVFGSDSSMARGLMILALSLMIASFMILVFLAMR